MNFPPLAESIADVRSELEFTSYKRFQGRAAFFAIVESADQKTTFNFLRSGLVYRGKGRGKGRRVTLVCDHV